MKTFKYIWRNVTRNWIRSSLTILSVGVSLGLMTLLYGFIASQDEWGKEAKKNNRIVVMNVQGFSGQLPIASVDTVRGMQGVDAAVPYSWYGGKYQNKEMPFAQFATDPNEVFNVWPEFTISEEELKAFKENRQGCVVDRRLLAKWGWKVGDRIPLQGTFYPFDLDLQIVGAFDSPQNTDSIWFSWSYLDEGLKQKNFARTGNSGTIFARVGSAEVMPAVIKAIDDRFESSDSPTRSQTEAAFAQMFVDMLGNVRSYIQSIAIAVVFSLSLVTANSMAMSMRERVTEIAVLKAIGFSRLRVLSMILGESMVVTFIGACIGFLIGCMWLQLLNSAIPQYFPFKPAEMIGPWMLTTFVAAAGIGLVSGLIPALKAAQLSVVDGLRRIG
ncbi:MAG: ABC transporter permease [Planctomyces sp.]|nr:ABC transporter permease [Planctomyces sp.]